MQEFAIGGFIGLGIIVLLLGIAINRFANEDEAKRLAAEEQAAAEYERDLARDWAFWYEAGFEDGSRMLAPYSRLGLVGPSSRAGYFEGYKEGQDARG